jgi:hypothetical protein
MKPKTKIDKATLKRNGEKAEREGLRYANGCQEGKKQAELYLHEIRLRPDTIGMPLLGDYVRDIRPDPADPRVSGLLVGFFARIEQEMARVVIEDIWRSATREERWKVINEIVDRPQQQAK